MINLSKIASVKEYEIMYIVKPVDNDVYEAVIKKYDDLINNNNGDVVKTERWGKKRLAYEIQDFCEGLYVLTTFAATPACVKELDRVMRIDDNVLRHMIISKG